MAQYVLKKHQLNITLEPKAFASGGEGSLFRVQHPELPGDWVAKIYLPAKRTTQREAKINYLLTHRPEALFAEDDKEWLWIKDLIYDDQGAFVGLLMPFMKGEKLEVLCSQKLPRSLSRAWRRMDLRQDTALAYRLKVGFNLAVAIYRLHSTERYVLVDMKPDNVLIQANGLLSIVDLDSMAINNMGHSLFPAPVATPEYTPPEYYHDQLEADRAVDPSWDRFGLAVILYKLFCGIHPFTGTASEPYDEYVSLHQKIEHGLFVHSEAKKQYLRVVPPPHQRFFQLSEEVRGLFMQCFEDGHASPSLRPPAEEWCLVLLHAIGEPQLMKRYEALLGKGWHRSSNAMVLPSELQQKYTPTPFSPQKFLDIHVNQWLPSLPIVADKTRQDLTKKMDGEKPAMTRFYVVWWGMGLFLLYLILESGLKYEAPIVTYSWAFVLAVFWMAVIPRVLAFMMKKRNTLDPKAIYQFLQEIEEKGRTLRQSMQKELWAKLESHEPTLVAETTLPESWVEYEARVRHLLQERETKCKAIETKYWDNAQKMPSLKEVEGDSLWDYWQVVQRAIRMEKARLNKARRPISRVRDLKEKHRAAKEALKIEFEEEQKKWLDEARLIFEDYALFEDEANGLLEGADKLQEALARKNITKLVDIRAVEWLDHRQLRVTKDEDQNTFILRTTRYAQLENFYQLYELYKASIQYAQSNSIREGKIYLQARFHEGETVYKNTIKELEETLTTDLAALKSEQQQQQSSPKLVALQQAEADLQQIQEAQQKELMDIEEHYEALYEPIRETIESTLKEQYDTSTKKREEYKMAVQELLESGPYKKVQTSFGSEIEILQSQIKSWENKNK